VLWFCEGKRGRVTINGSGLHQCVSVFLLVLSVLFDVVF